MPQFPFTTDAPTETRRELRFEFLGSAGEYFRIWIVNLCLTLLTFGIYSAWAKVRTSRYFAASTRLEGASFSYLANPIAILKGRLIVVGVLLAYGISSLFSPILELVFGIGVFIAIPWAVIRSLAFRARNTAWRNIRFAFGARYGEGFASYVALPTLGVLTLGGLFPYAIYRQRRFIVDHAAFGTTRFRFASGPGKFYAAFLEALVLLIAFIVSIAVGNILSQQAGLSATWLELFLLAAAPLYFLLFGLISARVTSLTYDGASLGDHRLKCRIPAFRLAWIYMTNALAIILSVGLLIPWTHVRLTRFRLLHISVSAAGSLEEFAQAQGTDVSSLGAEFGEAFDIDLGL